MKYLLKHLLIMTTLSLGFVATTHALPIVSLSATGQVNSSVTGVSTVDFNNGCGYSSCNGDYVIVSGNRSGKYAQPLGVNSSYLSVPNPSPTTKSATFGLGAAANYFGLYWGSIDSYNSISFYLSNALVANYSGSDVVGQFANGNQLQFSSNRYVNFDFGNTRFDTVKINSSGFAFESDNHAYKLISVTEPASLLLIVLGIACLWFVRRRVRN